jgi:hypothetical protein
MMYSTNHTKVDSEMMKSLKRTGKQLNKEYKFESLILAQDERWRYA